MALDSRKLLRRIGAARVVLTVEFAWPALWPAIAVLGCFIAASLFGLWLDLPLLLHGLLLALFAGAAVWAAGLARRTLRLASRRDAVARLERDSGMPHQPLRGLEDTLPDSVRDPMTRGLWLLHRARLEKALGTLKLTPPRSLMPTRDPWAFRALLLLILVVALVHARGDYGPRLAAAVSFARAEAPVVATRVDLWMTPPAYTRRAPLGSEQTRGQPTLVVPAGTVALAQLHHAALEEDGAVPQLTLEQRAQPFTRLGDGSLEARLEVGASGWLVVRDGRGQELASWFAETVPDKAPVVRFNQPPAPTYRRTLRLEIAAEDDYGLSELALQLAPASRADESERLMLQKPANRPPRVSTASFLDLTAHPLAGLPVRLQLIALDGLGQEGRSEPIEITLPEREFRHPLARAVIEQRRELVREPATAPDVSGRLAALAETEIATALPTSVPLSLRVAAARLRFGGEDAGSRASVVGLLWELALFIEDGALSVAERKLRELQEELQRALAEGADDKELERLMDELQQAMDEFLREMQRQATEQAQRGEQPPQAPADPSQMVERRDLQQMLDRAREMMRGGANDAAKEMLAQLQEMLENLRAGTAQAQMSPGQQALSDLQKMIQMQQQLLERSFDMQRQQGQQGQQGQQEGRQGKQQGQQGQQPGDQGQEMGQSASEQEALRRALGELMRRLGEGGMEIPRAMGQAEMQMRSARDALQGAEPGGAADSQAQAVDSMQRAGQAMMEQLQQQMADEPGPGQQPANQNRSGRDPLGRATRNDGGFETHGVEVPQEGDLSRARDVLQELYRRSGDRRRPPAELDYYNRLLDRF